MISISFVTAWMVDHLGLRNKDGRGAGFFSQKGQSCWGWEPLGAWLSLDPGWWSARAVLAKLLPTGSRRQRMCGPPNMIWSKRIFLLLYFAFRSGIEETEKFSIHSIPSFGYHPEKCWETEYEKGFHRLQRSQVTCLNKLRGSHKFNIYSVVEKSLESVAWMHILFS